jgi:tRNA A-37 threonylcarbamoyl transferase component Bud32
MTRNRGMYRYGVPVWKWRPTKYWKQAEIDEAVKEAKELSKHLKWE